MSEDGRADRRDVVLPSLVHAAREPQDPLEEADGPLDARSEALRELEARIELALLFRAVAVTLLRDGDDVHGIEDLVELFARPVALVGSTLSWRQPNSAS